MPTYCVTSDAGALLLGATDRAIRLLDRFARCSTDHRRFSFPQMMIGPPEKSKRGTSVSARRERGREWRYLPPTGALRATHSQPERGGLRHFAPRRSAYTKLR